MNQTKIFEETILFICKHVDVSGLSMSKLSKDKGIFQAIRIKFEDGEIMLEGVMTIKEMKK